MVRARVFRGRHALPATLLSAVGVLVLAAVPVQVTGSGIDLYALLFAGVLLLVVERTAGDWVANVLGPAGTALAFAIVAAAGVAYLLSDGGRKRAEHVMAVAEAHGYRAAYFKSEQKLKADPQEELAERVAHVPVAPGSVPDAPAPSPSSTTPVSDEAQSSQAQPSGSGLQLFSFGGGSREQATARLTAVPELAQLGDEIRLRFRVIGQPKKMPSGVSFYVNGMLVAHESVGPDGIAETQWRPRVPGQYRLRAETSASSLESRGFDAAVQVLPRQN
jgi:hypothetical protein